jgi:hypothetical protein
MVREYNALAVRVVEKYVCMNLQRFVGNVVVLGQQFLTEIKYSAKDAAAQVILWNNSSYSQNIHKP